MSKLLNYLCCFPCCITKRCKIIKEKNELRLLNDNELKFIPGFRAKIQYGRVIDVYDGDTITVIARHSRDVYFTKYKIRLEGIDTPEIKGVKYDDDAIRRKAVDARNYLRDLIYGKVVDIVVSKNKDKYGRVIAQIIYNGVNINKHMVEQNYAKIYNGKGDKNALHSAQNI